MAQLICPTCGTSSEDGYCRICMAYIPEPEPEADSSMGENLPVADEEQGTCDSAPLGDCSVPQGHDIQTNGQSVSCLSCGMLGIPGRECPQCGAMLPIVEEAQECDVRTAKNAFLVLPGGLRLALCDGKEYVIGRESDTPEIQRALSSSQYVSRRHCLLCVDLARGTVLVRDANSMNGTFVGADRRRVFGEETCQMPAVVWLGSHIQIVVNV